MKQYRVRLQTEAMEDLDQAYLFAARNAPETAARWYNRFYDALQALSNQPSRCMYAAENTLTERELRQLLYGKRPYVYRAIFTIDEESSVVWILRICRAQKRPFPRKELGENA